MRHKVYGSRIFSSDLRRKLIFWKEDGTKVLKENLEGELKKHKEILKARKKHGMEDQVIIFRLAVPIQYRDISNTTGFIKEKLNKNFEDFEFKIMKSCEDLEEEIRKKIDHKEIGKYEREIIIRDCYRFMHLWEKQHSEDQNEFQTQPSRFGNCFYGIKKNNS